MHHLHSDVVMPQREADGRASAVDGRSLEGRGRSDSGRDLEVDRDILDVSRQHGVQERVEPLSRIPGEATLRTGGALLHCTPRTTPTRPDRWPSLRGEPQPPALVGRRAGACRTRAPTRGAAPARPLAEFDHPHSAAFTPIVIQSIAEGWRGSLHRGDGQGDDRGDDHVRRQAIWARSLIRVLGRIGHGLRTTDASASRRCGAARVDADHQCGPFRPVGELAG